MSENVIMTIRAGNDPIYEILNRDGVIRIRHAEEHNRYIDLISSVLPTIANALNEVYHDLKKE